MSQDETCVLIVLPTIHRGGSSGIPFESWLEQAYFVKHGYGSKLNHQGTTGFGPCFHLPGFHLGYLFLTHGRAWAWHGQAEKLCRLLQEELDKA